MTDTLLEHLREVWKDHLDSAWSRGLSLLNGATAESTPLNASPYVVSLEDFFRRMEALPGRRFLRPALLALLKRLSLGGYAVDFMLNGGSFCDVGNPSPKDFDALCLYRLHGDYPGDPSLLVSSQVEGQASGLDIRFVATDGEPLVYLKALAYFSILYAQQKPSVQIERKPGLLLIDVRGFDLNPRT